MWSSSISHPSPHTCAAAVAGRGGYSNDYSVWQPSDTFRAMTGEYPAIKIGYFRFVEIAAHDGRHRRDSEFRELCTAVLGGTE
jgi:hypothetical protein